MVDAGEVDCEMNAEQGTKSMTTYLTNREALRAIADGVDIECRHMMTQEWVVGNGSRVVFTELDEPSVYRLAATTIPRTVTYPKPDLLPCPFCGGSAGSCLDANHSTGWDVGCFSSSCEIEPHVWAVHKSTAEMQWNTRADIIPNAAYVAGLEAALRPLAAMAERYDPEDDDGAYECWSRLAVPKIKHVPAARAALSLRSATPDTRVVPAVDLVEIAIPIEAMLMAGHGYISPELFAAFELAAVRLRAIIGDDDK